MPELENESPVIELLDKVLSEAVALQASDIHFEPFEDEFKIRCRVDGVVRDMATPPLSLAAPLISRLKVLTSLDVAETRVPQDGRASFVIDDKPVDFRISTLPTLFGESVVLRVLDKGNVDVDLNSIGIWEDDLPRYREVLGFTTGMVLVTGPTGSGKTTTLYAFLKELNQIERKIITVEDPVEYDLPGVVQIPVNAKIGLNFARCLRSILRQDPDVIMVGEIRDEETAQISVQSALTGHLVLSTLHTNNAPGAVARLIDMKVEPYLIVATVKAVIAQRLVRMICPKCIDSYEPTQKEIFAFDAIPETARFFKGSGCEECGNTGYWGRTSIHELLPVDERLHAAILQRLSTAGMLALAKENGMVTLREDGLRKAMLGITTLSEVIKETQL